jgi:uncharacterized protein YbjT (DUF2867 family)
MNRDSRTPERIVTVFGGTGLLGRRIVTRLLEKDFTVRAASRHPDRVTALSSSHARSPEAVGADILDVPSVASAIAGSHAVANAASLYVEHGNQTFERVHVKAAAAATAMTREVPPSSNSAARKSIPMRNWCGRSPGSSIHASG